MLDFTLRYLRCINCRSRLSAEPLLYGSELEEGFLNCDLCGSKYPVISSIPLLVADLSLYFSVRMSLGGELMLKSRTAKMRSFVKQALAKVRHASEDTTGLEKRWVAIYRKSLKTRFYRQVESLIGKLPISETFLEHGCSIGHVSSRAARRGGLVFGMDKSYYAISEAMKSREGNSDFVVADSLKNPFGGKFDTVLALNLLDIVEPRPLVRVLSAQAKKFLILSDPYDYERGKNSVKQQLGPEEVRSLLRATGFRLVAGTARQSFIPWSLEANPRLVLNYKVDLVVARRR
ncbi:MAG TPA: methyltransferase domain-containing protein [Candidatus Nitrosotalea sp.]|nr:methyltransferase domain-containing protein [Candidatus Nitrosotalea sp.]